MTSSCPIVILDACVLYPAALRSLMMWLAVHEVIRPKWTEQIHEEWIRNVLKDKPDLTREQLERVRKLMDEHAGDCLVSGYESRIGRLELPDPDDRHVLAAAIEAEADAIITWNISDFPAKRIEAYGIEVQTPDQLLCQLGKQDLGSTLDAVKAHRASLKNPPKSAQEYFETLNRQGLTETVAWMKPFSGEI